MIIESSSCTSIDLRLSAVPETALWTLHNRVSEAIRPDGFLQDPKAVEIYKSIAYDYEKSFGPADNSHAIRSWVFDGAIRDFWENYPGGTIVNLGEGLETQRFRLEEQRHDALWITVDLPSAIEARERFIQPDEDHIHIAASALDVETWAQHIPKDKPVFITAQGLFMYLKEIEVKALFQEIATRFPGNTVMFDSIAKWLSDRTMTETGWKQTEHYTTPKMPFGVNRFDAPPLFQSWVEGLEVKDIPWPLEKLRGPWRYIATLFGFIPIIRGYVPGCIFQLKFPTR